VLRPAPALEEMDPCNWVLRSCCYCSVSAHLPRKEVSVPGRVCECTSLGKEAASTWMSRQVSGFASVIVSSVIYSQHSSVIIPPSMCNYHKDTCPDIKVESYAEIEKLPSKRSNILPRPRKPRHASHWCCHPFERKRGYVIWAKPWH